MSAIKKDFNNQYSINELENLSRNIRAKAIKLGISLPKLSEMIGIDYVTLTRIVNYKNEYMPNLKALSVIANFFEVRIGDLLTNPDMPQYIPILQMSEIKNFLEKDNFDLTNLETIFSNEWIHEKAFAISLPYKYFENNIDVKFLLKPYNKLKVDKHLLIRCDLNTYYFLKIIGYVDHTIIGINLIKNETVKLITTNTEIIAIACKMLFNNNLI